MKFIVIVLVSVCAAVLYGIVHDQITIRVCPEYFTVAHPHIVDTHSLTLLALAWGVIATWWVGLPLGLLLAAAARLGRAPKLEVGTVTRRIGMLLAAVAVLAVAAGIAAWCAKMGGAFRQVRPELADAIDPAMHDRFVAAWAAHSVSYAVGAIGGVALAVWVAVERGRAAWRAAAS